jgi:purine-nucleoside phosphorylase
MPSASASQAAQAWLALNAGELVAWRRHLHRHPELSRQEFATTQFIAERLAGAGLNPKVLPSGTGLICDFGPEDGPRIALRADIDALPMTEQTGAPYSSLVPVVTHACGHDAHTAILLGAALALASAPELPVGVRLVFQAAEVVARRTGVDTHDVAIVLGSGWAPAVAALGTATASLPMADLPGFSAPTAAGHLGELVSIPVGTHRVLVLVGRIHAYEGHPLIDVVRPVRTAVAAGANTVVLTNAAGGLREHFDVGQPVLISDHLNMTGRSPLEGAHFVDMVDAYTPALRALARQVDPALAEGVYAGMSGPQYETPAEIRMLRTLGADLVGMSTVHEAIAARAAGAQVLGVSLVTNLAAGITGEPLSHAEVLAAGRESATRMGELLAEVIARL